MIAARLDRLNASLWPQGDLPTTPQVYALLDGARDRRIEPMIRLSGLEYACLYGGRLSPVLERAAPYLVHLTPRVSFTRELFSVGWGNSWGILTVVPPDCTIQQQRRHFRSLLRVQNEEGQVLAFRFYDPRVLRTYLPTCTRDEVAQVFGPIPRIAVESVDGAELLMYSHGDAGMRMDTLPLASLAEPPRAHHPLSGELSDV
jgi:hypothetical protein